MKIHHVTQHVFHLSKKFPDVPSSLTALVTDEGVVLVDTGSAEMAQDLRDAVTVWGFDKPTYIISTHEHTDHVGCNDAFGPGPIVVAHAVARQRLTSGHYIIEEIPEFALPNIEIRDEVVLRFGGEKIRIIPIPGSHTDNDLIVHFADANVACLSDLFYGKEMFPSVDAMSGNVDLYPECVKRALDVLPRDVIVTPGHSQDVFTWSDVHESYEMLVATIATVKDAAAGGVDLEELKAAHVLGEWDRFGQGFTSTDQWIKYIWRGIAGELATATVIEPLYHVLQTGTGHEAVEAYRALKVQSPTDYFFQAGPSLRIVYYLIAKDRLDDALVYLRFMLDEFSDSQLAGYIYDAMGDVHARLGQVPEALAWTRKAVERNPELDHAHARIAQLKSSA
jgi:cyclase